MNIITAGTRKITIPNFGPVVPARPAGGAAAFDEDAETLFAAMSVEPDAARKTIINDTIVALKSAGIWAELDEAWFFAAHNAADALLGWKRYKDCLNVNSATFTEDAGYQGDGATSYLNTQYNPTTDGINYLQDDASMGVYSNTDIAEATRDMGGTDTIWTHIAMKFSDNLTSTRLNNNGTGGGLRTAVADSLGLFAIRRPASDSQQEFKDGALLAENSTASGGLPNRDHFICAYNGGSPTGYSNRQYAFAFVGSAMTTGQQASLNTIVQDYLDAINP